MSVALTALLLLAQAGSAEAAYTLAATYAVGQQPFAVVSDPKDGRLYVANSGTTLVDGRGTVSVIDPSTGLVGTLFTSHTAGLLALDSAARRLYASDCDTVSGATALDVFDVTGGALVTSLPIGGLGVALDPSASRLVTAAGRVLFAVDTNTMTVTNMRFAPGTESWFGVAVDPVLHRAYVANVDNSAPSIAVFDTRDLTPIGELSLPTVPRWAIAIDVATHRVFVGGSDRTGPPFAGSAVYAIDGATLAVLASAPVRGFPMGIALAPASGHLYVTDAFGQVLLSPPGYPVNEFAMDTLAFTQTLSSPAQPALDAIGPDGRLYVSGSNPNGGVVEAFAFPPPDRPPVIDQLTLLPVTVHTNDQLTASVVAHDPDGDALSFTFTWSVNGVTRRTTTTSSTSDTLDLSGAGNGDRGDLVEVSVTASDGTLESGPASASVTVANSSPTVTVSLSSTAPKSNDVLVATAIGADPDHDTLTYTYTWSVNKKVKQVDVTSSSTSSFDLHANDAANGDVVTVSVTVSDGAATSSAASAAASIGKN